MLQLQDCFGDLFVGCDVQDMHCLKFIDPRLVLLEVVLARLHLDSFPLPVAFHALSVTLPRSAHLPSSAAGSITGLLTSLTDAAALFRGGLACWLGVFRALISCCERLIDLRCSLCLLFIGYDYAASWECLISGPTCRP